jgi:predicted metal-dependent enzyme (double-stranded beta helix superfamily)
MKFADAVREVLEQAARGVDRPTPASLIGPLRDEAGRYLEHVRYDTAQYIRHPVLFFDDWEVMVIGWSSGQVTPIHDHRGVMGGMAVLSGSLLEERFTTPESVPSLVDSRTRPEGDLCHIGPTVLHRLVPTSARAASLHIYRPPLRTMGIWDERGFQEVRPSVFEYPVDVLGGAQAPVRC